VQQFVAGLLEFSRRRRDRRSIRDVELDADLRHGPLRRPLRDPKHASAAWASGQIPNDLQPAICSLW
jgi:hypothetical protein